MQSDNRLIVRRAFAKCIDWLIPFTVSLLLGILFFKFVVFHYGSFSKVDQLVQDQFPNIQSVIFESGSLKDEDYSYKYHLNALDSEYESYLPLSWRQSLSLQRLPGFGSGVLNISYNSGSTLVVHTYPLSAAEIDTLKEKFFPLFNAFALIIFMLILGIFLLFYCLVQLYLLQYYGQTIGKKILDIKIVDLHSNRIISGRSAFIRVVLLRTILNSILTSSILYWFIDSLMIFRKDRRCIHDFIAESKVISGDPA